MNKFLLYQMIFAFILSHFSLSGQGQAISKHQIYKKAGFADFIKGYDNEIYTFGPQPYYNNDEDYILRKYSSNNFEPLMEYEYENFGYGQIDADQISYSSSLSINNKTYLFFEARDTRAGIIYLLKRELQPDMGLGPIEEISRAVYHDRGFGVFKFYFSQDSSKIGIFAGKDDLKAGFIPTVKVFDKNLNQLWHKSLAVPAKESFLTVVSLTVSNEGDVFLLTLNKDRKIKHELASDNYHLYHVNKEGIDQVYDLSQLGVVVHFGKLYCDVDGKLLFFGLSGNDEDHALATAFLSFDLQSKKLLKSRLENLTEAQQKSLSERSRDVINNFVTWGRGYHRLKFGELYHWGNGIYTILAEHYYFHGRSKHGPIEAEAWEIHSFTVDSMGKPISSIVFNKKTYGSNDNSTPYGNLRGYIAQKVGKELVLLYNFPPNKINELSSGELTFDDLNLYRTPTLLEARVNPINGKVKYSAFIDDTLQEETKNGSYFDPEEYIKIGSHTYIGELHRIPGFWFYRFEISAN